MRYLLVSTEDDTKKCIDVPKEMIKASRSKKEPIKRLVPKEMIKASRSKKEPIKRLQKKKQSSKPMMLYKRNWK